MFHVKHRLTRVSPHFSRDFRTEAAQMIIVTINSQLNRIWNPESGIWNLMKIVDDCRLWTIIYATVDS